MAIVAQEKELSRNFEWNGAGTLRSAELLYDVSGTDDQTAAKAAVMELVPLIIDGVPLDGVKVEAVTADETTETGRWTATVSYALAGGGGGGGGSALLSFDTTGGTQHLTQSLNTQSYHSIFTEGAPDFKGGIGVTHDSVEGVDITAPAFKFSISKKLPAAMVTPGYLRSLMETTGKVNATRYTAGPAGSFECGELLFLGATGSLNSKRGHWEIQYNFAASPNDADMYVGDIYIPFKKGWEYLWFRYEDAEDTVAKCVLKRATAAYVEQVYDEQDFTWLIPDV